MGEDPRGAVWRGPRFVQDDDSLGPKRMKFFEPCTAVPRLYLPQYQTIISNQPTRNKKPTMRNSSISLIAVALLCLSSLPSSTAFSASLKVQGNETKISYDYKYSPSTSHDSEVKAPIEVESWTEALSSPKVQEPGNSFILQAQMHGPCRRAIQ